MLNLNEIDLEGYSRNIYKSAKKCGFVYILQSGVIHKIGRCFNLEKRLKGYDTHNPNYKLIYFLKVKNCIILEKKVLDIFKEKKIKGEWFNLTNDDINSIKKIWKMAG